MYQKNFYVYLFMVLTGLMTGGAACTPDAPDHSMKMDNAGGMEQVLEEPSGPLTVPEYLLWIRSHRKITFDEDENEQMKITMSYRPAALEAARSSEFSLTSEAYERIKAVKKKYHYVEIEYLDKTVSAQNRSGDKKALLLRITDNLLFIKNISDTIYSPVTEVFRSALINQPDRIFIIIPADTIPGRLRSQLSGSEFGLKDLQLDINEDRFDSFPEIKL